MCRADRLELEIVGWMPGKRSQSIDYIVIAGDTSLPDTWTKLETVLNETFLREDGVYLPISMHVYRYGL
jgi:phage terminase large subunit GpA-like protein